MRRFLTHVKVDVGGHAPAWNRHGAKNKKAARQSAERAQLHSQLLKLL
jgi:hypothetical protein